VDKHLKKMQSFTAVHSSLKCDAQKMQSLLSGKLTESIGFYQVDNLLNPVSRLSFGKMVFGKSVIRQNALRHK